jgi:competence protein ComEC
MNCLGALFKNNCLYIALSLVIIVLAVYETIIFLLGSCLLFIWLLMKRLQGGFILAFVGITVLFFIYVQMSKFQVETSPSELYLASYEIIQEPKWNGSIMRTFIKNKQGQQFYVSYETKSEVEKQRLQQRSLVGWTFLATGQLTEVNRAHLYSFSMENYLQAKQAFGPYELTQLTWQGHTTSLRSSIAQNRYQVAAYIERQFPTTLASEAKALLIGIQDDLPDELQRAYQKLGITHLFAISGLHITLLSYLFYEGLLLIRVRKEIAYGCLLICLPLYALLAGGAPSIWRAVSIVEIFALSRLFRQKWQLLDVLSISCCLLIILRPTIIYEIGFQLSYLATYSIVLSVPLLKRASTIWHQNFYVTVVAQLLTYPFLLLHFYELSLSSFVANIFFVPLFSFIILPINLICLLPQLNQLVFRIYEPLRTSLDTFFYQMNTYPQQMWVPGKPSTLWLIVLISSVIFSLYYLCQEGKWKKACWILMIPALLLTIKPYFQNELQISFINVGQGDSILIELPHRKGVYLIDSGGLLRFETESWKERNRLYEVGKQVVVPYLKGKGISSLDVFVFTHADADHIEGAEEVLKEIRVGEIHITPGSLMQNEMADVRVEANKRKIPIIEKIDGDRFGIKDVQLRYLHPNDLHYEGNNDSLVLLLQVGGFKALFTGDLEKEGENRLVQEYGALIANSTLLKAGHHGSKTSSSEQFLRTVNPQLTIFTAGKNNRYKHPAKEVIERMETLNLQYVVTGYDGTQIFSIKVK